MYVCEILQFLNVDYTNYKFWHFLEITNKSFQKSKYHFFSLNFCFYWQVYFCNFICCCNDLVQKLIFFFVIFLNFLYFIFSLHVANIGITFMIIIVFSYFVFKLLFILHKDGKVIYVILLLLLCFSSVLLYCYCYCCIWCIYVYRQTDVCVLTTGCKKA